MQKLFIGHDALQKIVNTDRSDVQMTCKPDANVCKICEARFQTHWLSFKLWRIRLVA